jgi:hypothetical protein
MVQLAGSVAFGGAAMAFVFMGDPILGFLAAACALVWAATTSERRPLRLPRGEILRRP